MDKFFTDDEMGKKIRSRIGETGMEMSTSATHADLLASSLNGLAGAYGALGAGIADFWVSIGEGEADFSKSMSQAFGSWLKMFSKEMQLNALKYLAMGAVAAVTPGQAGLAAGYFAGAAIFQAAAATSGIAGGAMTGAGKKKKGRGTSQRGLGGTTTRSSAPAANLTFNINTMLATADEQEFSRAIGNGVKMAKARGHI